MCMFCTSLFVFFFFFFWSLCCLSLYLQILLPLWYLLVIVLSVPLFTDSVTPLVSFGHCVVCPFIYRFCYPFGIFRSLCCLSLYLRILLPLWYLLVIVLSVPLFTDSVTPLVSLGHCVVCPFIYRFCYPFGIFWSLCCLSLYLQILLPLWYL